MSLIIPHRRLNLNKLVIFGWEEYDKIVFMDADTVCKGDIADLFKMPGEFAATQDIWWNKPLDPSFNSGVMVFTPRKWLFKNMIEKLSDPDYHDPTQGDQDFLQKYWEYENWGLPAIYNLNLVLYEFYKQTWDYLWMDTRIIHYTVRKPVEKWDPVGQCERAVKGMNRPKDKDGKVKPHCAVWVPIAWYSIRFKEMRKELGFENEIGLLA